jgi:toxin YhaV
VRIVAAKQRKTKKEPASEPHLKKGDWTLFAHTALLDQLDKLEAAAVKENDPQGDATKVLAWLTRAIFDEIPADPTLKVYRLGGALAGITHWFRDKYAGRFRLFFRYDSRSKIIVFGWVNDENSLRTYGAKTDAYAVFRDKLAAGNPPDNWADLLKEASREDAVKRFKGKSQKGAKARRRP